MTRRGLEDNSSKTVPQRYSKTFTRSHDGGPTGAEGRWSSKEHIRSRKAKLVQMSGSSIWIQHTCWVIPADGRHRQKFLLQQKEKKIRQLGNRWIGNRTACIRAPATIAGPTTLGYGEFSQTLPAETTTSKQRIMATIRQLLQLPNRGTSAFWDAPVFQSHQLPLYGNEWTLLGLLRINWIRSRGPNNWVTDSIFSNRLGEA